MTRLVVACAWVALWATALVALFVASPPVPTPATFAGTPPTTVVGP